MQLEHLFTEEQKAIRDMIRKFVEKEIMPIREKMEEDYSLVEGVHNKLVELGIQKAGYPTEYGGGGGGSMMNLGIICEELARGDAGISLTVGINAGIILAPAIHAGNKAVLDKFVPAFCGNKLNYACISMTDATGGADTENPILKGRGITTRAQLDGDEWVINGTKSWPTHAGIASVYLTVCTTDPEAGDEGVALIYVPYDAKGPLSESRRQRWDSKPLSMEVYSMITSGFQRNTGWQVLVMTPSFIISPPTAVPSGIRPPFLWGSPRPLLILS